MDVWKPQKIELDRCFQVQIGPLGLWIKRAGDELLMAVENLPESKAQIQAPILAPVDQEEGLRWSRWIIGESEVIQLIPVMPDRPVVVRPEVPVKIPTDKEALFFVSIPIWVRVTAGSEQAILCEQPSLILSNIWFGDLMSGELCYSLRSRARRRITDSEPLLNRATCPVQIRNAAPTHLDVQRFCLHVERLKIYAGQKQLWTNQIRITFKGDEKAGHVDYSQGPPTFEPVGQMLSEARAPLKRTLLEKSLGGFGLLTAI